MSKADKFKNKNKKTKKKNDLPVLESDKDFLSAFLSEKQADKQGKKENFSDSESSRVNKHGLPFVENYESQFLPKQEIAPGKEDAGENPDQEVAPDEVLEEDFAQLLAESFKQKRPSRVQPKPMPLKRRLKRYPAPEADLDLHGFTALGAQIKAKSFINGAKHQGFFTLRIIVGRGLHSEEGPVLPHVIEDLLKGLKKEKIVLAYKWEGSKKGKSGSVIVYLKQFSD